MQKYQHFNFILNLLYQFFKFFIIAIIFMGLARLYLFLSYGGSSSYEFIEVVASFFLGTRLDASILAYIFSLPIILSIFISIFRLKFLQHYLYSFFRFYFLLFFTLLFLMIFIDFTYFSFFASHSTLMIFGVFDDDTQALISTAFANYNVPLVALGVVMVLSLIYLAIFKIIREKETLYVKWGFVRELGFFLLLIVIVALLGRGSLGLFPLAYNTPDPTSNQFLNELSKSAPFALIDSYTSYEKSKSGKYDLIQELNYRGKMPKAFKIHTQKEDINRTNLIENIKYKTAQNEILEQKPPHVVVVMVESFGMPLLSYQSESFNIMGSIKKHFQEDTLFTNFISASNGTIVSLEPLLLNITARPNSTAFAQSNYLNTVFTQASARVYQNAGYETSFIYGGDMSWRSVGNFMSKQGFDNIEGKAAIIKSLKKDESSITHDWGVFDEYLYEYVEKKLLNAKKPQFVFVLTTNNHPPYKIPKEYKSNSLKLSKELKAHITGDIDLAKKRFIDYAYAVDMAGKFMDKIKSSKLKKNTLVAITADNNTVEGIMSYDDYYTQTKRIPFYIYIPEYIKPKVKINEELASSHKDIFPTLYNLTLSEAEYTAIGTNLLDTKGLHCGFNDAGVIMSQSGGFKNKKAITDEQKKCQEYYRASLAVTEYLIKSQK